VIDAPKTDAPKILRSIDDLAAAGLLGGGEASALKDVARRYAIAITPEMTALIDAEDPADPIARQFVPDARELDVADGERRDPIGDDVHEKVPGLVHRYPDRVLLKVTHACPVYCRFCFRREMVGPGGPAPLAGEGLKRAIAYIAARHEIFEVILTGGDPLVLSPRRIRELTEALARLTHVKVLRWHSRVPVVDPARVTDALTGALRATGQTVYVGIHANHPRELGAPARTAIARLQAAGLLLVSQTVLLKGVNDDAATLEALFRAFIELGVRPYYLHHADLASGTAHFRTTLAEGQALMRALRGRLSGLALPTYVLDIPGGHGKVPVGPAYVDNDAGTVTDPAGITHAYPPVTDAARAD
jgi:lysine 2,3-aminomutase